MATRIKQPGPYRVADYPTREEFKALGLIDRKDMRHVRAVATGEKRPPRAGEFYLSGADVQAYRAPNDLTTAFHIARLVRVETTTIVVQ